MNERDTRKVLQDSGTKVTGGRLDQCKACAEGMLSRKPFMPKPQRQLARNQELLAVNYVGPMEVTSHDGFTVLVSIMMEPYHIVMVFPVKDNSSSTQL